MRRDATFDPTQRYRYALRRVWERSGTRLLFVMLNPSTADARVDDPTIRRCIGYAHRLGHGSLEVVNLFAFRTPHPRVLARAQDPVGANNDRAVRQALRRADAVVAAWGNGAGDARSHTHLERRVAVFSGWVRGRRVDCLGMTRRGQPRHPLRVRADAPLVPWAPARATI